MKGLGCTLGLETGAPSRLAPLPGLRGGGVDPSIVAAERWGVTRRTSMSDTSEQLDGRSGLRSAACRSVGGRLLLLNSKGVRTLTFGIICLCSALGSDFACRSTCRMCSSSPGFSQTAAFNVTLRREVMKWSNYGSICAIQMKPGVKFPICAPAVLSIQCTLTRVLPVSR